MENTEASQWYYELRGTRNGPVSEEKIVSLIEANVINYDTQVWRDGFQDWKRISETELQKLMTRMGPPPLTGYKVNNFYIWLLAFAPIIGGILEALIIGINAGINGIPGGSLSDLYWLAHRNDYWYVPLVLNLIICWLDQRQLKKAGHDTSRFVAWIILIPVYIYKRCIILKQNMACLFVWIISFVLCILPF